MTRRGKPERLEMEIEELEAIVARAEKEALSPEDRSRLKAGIATLAWLVDEIERKSVSIARLQRLLFGTKTEKTKNILGMKSEEGREETESTAGATENEKDGEKEKPDPGHGRNGAEAYSGAERIRVPHESLKAGCACPGCRKGKLYLLKEPYVIVRVRGQAPLGATVWEKEALRCHLCGEVFAAKTPEGVGEEKYDASAAAIIALLKYGTGFPFNRLEKVQGSVGIPLPATTQWEIVEEAADVIAPAHEEIIREAAQGEVLHNDDTPMRVLSLVGGGEAMSRVPDEGEEQAGTEEPKKATERTGVFTSGIVSVREGRRIGLFFTGQKHAGENLTEVLRKRASGLPPPIQMCDGLSRNEPSDEFETVLGNCVGHGRRKFVELVEVFPEDGRHVIESLRVIYRNDAIARVRKLSPEERLRFHQEQSRSVMDDLKLWMEGKLERKEVEPNSPLGGAMNYMLKRWEKLTLFLRQPGAPLDNNICERALKKAIQHRKNALFYKTENGARVGDVFMSLIHTAELSGANPLDYLTALLKHGTELKRDPGSWMPWNYRATIEAAEAAAAAPTPTAQPP
jgi:transposase